MKTISLLDMLKAGVHFGHQRFRRNPKMDRYIYTTRGGLSIIDLEQTAVKLQEAFDFVVDLVSRGGTVMFLGTKKQAAESVKKMAEEAKTPYMTHRWLGGTFTNFETITRQIKRLREIEEQMNSGEIEKYTKYERLEIERELERLKKDFGGIAALDKLPDALFVVGVNKEKIAINEAKRKGIPVIGLVDTNCNPETVQFPIPSNDDAVKSIELLMTAIVAGIEEGRARQMKKAAAENLDPSMRKDAKKESKEEK